jgi:3-oxoacyl-[acyl-carrier protein] reductase
VKIENKVAIVTGSGRGIGKAIALTFGREGAHLVLASRTLSEVEATALEARSEGRQALAMKVDVSLRQEVEAMVASTLAEFGRIDILVNNAAVQPPIGPLWENDSDEWLRTVLINLGGVFLCCRAVVPAMIRQGGGKIINLSGGGASSPRPYLTAYAASKAAVVRLTETLAEEVKEFGIQVNAIAPGAASTRMTEEILAAGSAAGAVALAEARQAKEEARTPELAVELAVFLASDESDGLTGKLISAVWDDWRGMKEYIEEILSSDVWTLRRVPLTARASRSLGHTL